MRLRATGADMQSLRINSILRQRIKSSKQEEGFVSAGCGAVKVISATVKHGRRLLAGDYKSTKLWQHVAAAAQPGGGEITT